ncbi:unnamed protein product [Rotaria magnacalcarata]|uniref:G-protein coupled receptors family 1 profile domain-containing protein n=1 Tax=Rotaria magnacalcarata TaxID=392030 RepID=A0A815BSG1_9BILA|nr:unnamed protein product [Rotaria magnacalcarata]
MNNTLSSISSALIVAPYQLNIWFGIFLWVTGNLGSIGEYARFQIHVTTRYDVICKLRQFFSIWGNQVSFTLFSLATLDRLLSTQRAHSNRGSAALTSRYLLFIGHRLILYKAKNRKCAPRSGFYAYFDNYIEIVFTAICPPVAVIVLTYLLIRSVRNVIQRQIISGNNAQAATVAYRSNLEQMDSRLTSMLILQSMIVIITYIPFAAELVYTNVTQN